MTSATPLDPSTSSISQRPLHELLSLAAPTVAQMASYTVMQFADTFMLSHVGDVPATAAGQSGLVSFSIISFGVGVLLLVNTLVSQSFGRRDVDACGQYMWQGVWLALAFGLIVLPLLPLARPMFAALGHEAEMARLEAVYFQITVAAAAPKLAAMSLGQFLLAVNRPNAVLAAAAITAVIECVLNWAMVFGKLGFPPMGVRGAAWSTNAGVVIELLILTFIVSRPAMARTYNVGNWKPRWDQMKTLLVVGVPSGVQIVAEVVAWSLFTVWVVALFDVPTQSANIYTFRFMSVSFMPAFGLSAAVTALVGRYIGRGRPDVAMSRAHLGFWVTAVYTLACGLLFFIFRYRLMHLFSNDAEVVRIGAILLLFAAAYQVFDAMYIIYNGALRGAGDTFAPAVVTGVLCWGMTVFGAYAVAKLFPSFGIVGPWGVALSYGMILGVYLLIRFSRGRWRSIDLSARPDSINSKTDDDSATVVAFPVASEP